MGHQCYYILGLCWKGGERAPDGLVSVRFPKSSRGDPLSLEKNEFRLESPGTCHLVSIKETPLIQAERKTLLSGKIGRAGGLVSRILKSGAGKGRVEHRLSQKKGHHASRWENHEKKGGSAETLPEKKRETSGLQVSKSSF